MALIGSDGLRFRARRRAKWRKVNLWGELECPRCGSLVHDRTAAALHDEWHENEQEMAGE